MPNPFTTIDLYGEDGFGLLIVAWARASHVTQSTVLELPITTRHVRISGESHRVSATSDLRPAGSFWIYARDAYYSGHPLIVDDMFDRVELRLRWFGSKSVVKSPRCSIRRQSTFADAENALLDYVFPLLGSFPLLVQQKQNKGKKILNDVVVGQEDLSMIFALASTWAMFHAFGSLACVGPISYTIGMAYQNAFDSGLSLGSQTSGLAKVLQGLWRNDLTALKGACPNCGEEVFAFVRMDRNIESPHRADCHVCECILEFRTKVEQSVSRFGRQWVYGHIYLVSLRQIPTPITAVNFLPICLCSYSKDQSSSAPYSYF
ncbi:PGR5-like protein 1B, chloroplastic [Glycine soja]